jgi:hypothetical protein
VESSQAVPNVVPVRRNRTTGENFVTTVWKNTHGVDSRTAACRPLPASSHVSPERNTRNFITMPSVLSLKLKCHDGPVDARRLCGKSLTRRRPETIFMKPVADSRTGRHALQSQRSDYCPLIAQPAPPEP